MADITRVDDKTVAPLVANLSPVSEKLTIKCYVWYYHSRDEEHLFKFDSIDDAYQCIKNIHENSDELVTWRVSLDDIKKSIADKSNHMWCISQTRSLQLGICLG